MRKEEAKKRIEKLKELINYHRYLYHVENKQTISESAFDSLKHELYKLEQLFPDLVTPDSPTQKVAGKPLKGFKKIRHSVSMLSIEDIFSEEELKDWEGYLKRLLPSERFDFFTELKIDGFAVSLVYDNGILVSGSTRGDGKIGEDVTQNIKTIGSIPLKLEIRAELPDKVIKNKVERAMQKGRIEVRGEVYMEKKNFETLNKKLEKEGEKTYSNPRNLAAGSIRQLDPRLAASRPLDFFAYSIITDLGQKKHSKEHQILKVLGFKADQGLECRNIDEVVSFWKKIAQKRNHLSFQIDGIVVSVNDNFLFSELGVVGKSPRGIRAFKFSPEQSTTRVLDVKFQVGRTGVVTPVAVLRPVEIGGVIVSRATLHNEDEIKRLGLKIGDTVIVGRAGDVIPDIIKVLPELRDGGEKRVQMPQQCPACHTKIVRPEGEVIWRCPNSSCYIRQKRNFYHFVSKKAFNIIGLGPKIIDRLLDEGLVSDPADLFTLKEGDIVPLERFAEKSAQNLIQAIQSRNRVSFNRFIYSLGIRNVGEETAHDLAEYFGGPEGLKKASIEELEQVSDIGPVVAQSIYDFFQKKQNLDFIDKLNRAGVSIDLPIKSKSNKLKGLTFVLTGSLNSMSRDSAKSKIKDAGGEVSESISKNTSYLVVGKEPGSKLEKAKNLKAKILNEKEFIKILSR